MSQFLQSIYDFLFAFSDTYIPPSDGIGQGTWVESRGVMWWIYSLIQSISNNPVFLVLIFAPIIIGFSVGLFKRIKNM